MSTAVDEKTQGQATSVRNITPEAERAFLDWVRSYAPGSHLSVNDLRSRLDALAVPNRARGGLFRHAVAEGLLDLLETTVAGYTVAVKIPSTGRSAHRALVQVYRRSGAS